MPPPPLSTLQVGGHKVVIGSVVVGSRIPTAEIDAATADLFSVVQAAPSSATNELSALKQNKNHFRALVELRRIVAGLFRNIEKGLILGSFLPALCIVALL